MVEKKLALLGEVCPLPLVKTKSVLEEMNPGDILIVETDFNQSVRNILKWCEDQKYDFELDEIDNGYWQITVTKR